MNETDYIEMTEEEFKGCLEEEYQFYNAKEFVAIYFEDDTVQALEDQGYDISESSTVLSLYEQTCKIGLNAVSGTWGAFPDYLEALFEELWCIEEDHMNEFKEL